MSENLWSLVLAEFTGKWDAFRKAAPQIFGRKGLDVFGLVLGRETLPAELMESLAYDRATQIAAACADLGAHVTLVPTAQVGTAGGGTFVRYRAHEVWATHVTDNFEFTELEALILAAPALNARRNLAVLRRSRPEFADWQIERGLNHVHADASLTHLAPRARVREEEKLARLYEHDLRTLYPDTCFVLAHIVGASVSFYQRSDGTPPTQNGAAPRELAHEEHNEKVWCVNCHYQQPYRLRAEADPEFPGADWGECLVCGREVLVASREMLRLIGPSACR